MLADRLDYVIGVDSHVDQHVLVVVAGSGELVCEAALPASEDGYRRALRLVSRLASGRRVWAIEGTGGYGAGLTRFLLERGVEVLEVDRPDRRTRRRRGKSDPVDAEAAARAVLAGTATAVPKSADGVVEMIRQVTSRQRHRG
jgi:transposase